MGKAIFYVLDWLANPIGFAVLSLVALLLFVSILKDFRQ